MYNHDKTSSSMVVPLKTTDDDDDAEDSVFSYIPMIILDLRKEIEEFREACCDTVLGDTFNDDCEELKIIMPYIRYVKHDFMTRETGHDFERGVPGYIVKDIEEMFASSGEEQASIIGKAHGALADKLVQAFVNVGFINEEGIIPYSFVKRLTPDAFLFASAWAEIITGVENDKTTTVPLLSSKISVRQRNPEQDRDLIRAMVKSSLKKRGTVYTSKELEDAVNKTFQKYNTLEEETNDHD